jgi:tRNA A-37 threonylcarbamoyl transferase component Bud32
MSAEQKASTTMIWLKQLTTSTFSTINRKVDRIAFIKRNKKPLIALLAGWFLLMVAGYFIITAMGRNQLDNFLQSNASAVEQLAQDIGPILLDADQLGLSRKVTEFTSLQGALFTVILDHENKVVAHSNPEKLNRPFEPLVGESTFGNVDDVVIHTGQLADGRQVATFMRRITFSGVQIGSAIFGIPLASLKSVAHQYLLYKVLFIVVGTLLAAGAMVAIDRLGLRLVARRQAGTTGRMDGLTIGPYRLREKIAQGGMAELYKADYLRQDGFRRSMAIKRVLPHLAENQDFINMFIREARLAALLQHPNIVQIFDFGKIQNAYFIAMEYIDGMNLGQIMARLKTGLPVDMAIFLAIKISLGLEYSHKRKDDETGQPLGIVHRDISPQNILVSYQGEVKISDFGISKANTEPSLTQAGVIKGKLSYLSPEQALGQPVDQQSDIYALGLVLYEILTAKRVCHFDSDIEAIRTIPEMVIAPLIDVRPDIPLELSQVIMKALEKSKTSRYRDARGLHDDLLRLKAKLQIPYDASDLSNFMRTTFGHA